MRVNFGRPMPLFPLDDAVLLPHAVVPLHIFEPRYRQMLRDILSGSGQFAMAVFEGDRWKHEYHGAPPIRAAVCIARVVQHERLPDGRYNILVQGVCRGRVLEEVAPEGEERQYRLARLAPVGAPASDAVPHDADARVALSKLLRSRPLKRFVDAQGAPLARGLAVYLDRDPDDAPTTVVVDLIGQYLVRTPGVKYRLLAEADPAERLRVITAELRHLASLIRRADLQVDPHAPKGVTWN